MNRTSYIFDVYHSVYEKELSSVNILIIIVFNKYKLIHTVTHLHPALNFR